MRAKSRWIIVSMTFLCLAAAAGRASAQHPLNHLHHSLWELKDALKELKESTWKFGEHKAKAEVAMANAIRQIELIFLHEKLAVHTGNACGRGLLDTGRKTMIVEERRQPIPEHARFGEEAASCDDPHWRKWKFADASVKMKFIAAR